MVCRFAAVWERTACGIWDGDRASGGLDLRVRSCSRNDSVPQNALHPLPVIGHWVLINSFFFSLKYWKTPSPLQGFVLKRNERLG